MTYEVLNVFEVGEDTSVTIRGNGDGLNNNMIITGDDGIQYKIISIAMVAKKTTADETTILIKGRFDSQSITF